ncbi:MAG: DNA polymerase III subunit beta [Planctomycetota bacterium]|jgi:DNA polymerase-3 subunit beta
MKVVCDRSALVEAVSQVGAVVVSRTPTPVLLCIKLKAEDGRLELSATDLEVGLRMSLDEVDIEEAGEALVPADKLSQIIRACDDPTLTLETEEHAMHIRGENAHFKVYGFDPGDAPAVRAFGEAKIDCELDAGMLRTLVHRTLFAAAAEHSRYAINGVLFVREGKKVMMVAAIEENQVVFGVGEEPGAAVLSSNLVEGAFPPFEDVIPKDQDKKVSFDATQLSSAIRRAALLTNEESKGVRLTFADKKLTLTSRAPEMGEAEIELDVAEYEGEPLEIGFNPGFITDALKVVDTGEVIIELKAPNKPGVIRTGNDFTYVVMPVNLQ